MSEFKFACPVCGQHITADHAASGSHIECPTCFTKLVVPSERAGDSKLVYTAVKVSAPAPAASSVSSRPGRPFLSRIPVAGILFFVVLGIVAGTGVWWKNLQGRRAEYADAQEALTNRMSALLKCRIPWNANPTNVSIPAKPVSGMLKGQRFSMDRATLQGGTLALRQGRDWPPDLSLHVLLFARKPETLAQKTILIWPDRPPPVPKLVLRWKSDNGTNHTQDIRSGYAMKLVFGSPTNDVMPGSIYVSLPDESLGMVAGTFEAEIRKPAPRTRPSAPGHLTPPDHSE